MARTRKSQRSLESKLEWIAREKHYISALESVADEMQLSNLQLKAACEKVGYALGLDANELYERWIKLS